MIKIHKSTGKKTGVQFYVTYHGKNNAVLACTELLKTKQSAIKNIKAMAGLFFVEIQEVVKVVDCTGKEDKIIVL